MRALLLASLPLFGCPLILAAQAAGAPAQAVGAAPSDAARIAAAVAPLPEAFRADATVLGRREPGGALEALRPGEGLFICLADEPDSESFHVACYHRALEPFMARGRELRARGHAADVDSIRNAEIAAGTLTMPAEPTSLYSLTGERDVVDLQTGAVSGARPLYVVYIPNATAESSGLPVQPTRNMPWLMFPGTPGAHIMYVPEANR
jgi:hypothetical protein